MSGQVSQTSVRVPASVPVALRGLGVASLVLACLIIVATMMAVFLDGTAVVVATAVVLVLAAAPIAAVVTAFMRIRGKGAHLTYDQDSFENRTAFVGVGVRDARWPEVRALDVRGETLIIELDGDRRSVVHASVLGYTPEDLGEALRPLVGRPF